MQAVKMPQTNELKRVGRRFGLGIAIAINVFLLYVVLNLTSWDVLPFLTADFDSVVPWISFSLIVTIAANLVYMVNDDFRLKAFGDMITTLVSLVVTWRVLQVFPFDFSAYEFSWDVLVRVVLIVAIVGTFAGAVAAAVRLVRGRKPEEKGGMDVGAI